jgi:formylglycine-generating enzyme required for sulfatase activity/serine/threonine protein kinase
MQNAIDKIRELRALHEDGLLTREEFDERKNSILGTASADQVVARPGTELGLMAGQELGQPGRRYRLERLIARGGMAEVWQAEDLATEAQLGHSAQVALKILPPQAQAGSHHARLLLEEAVRARRLAHDHIVRVYDWALDPATGSPFVIMEYLDGEDLAALLAREGRMPVERACALLEPVADALDYAWTRHSLVHRDIKPANVLVTTDGLAKLLDFGIAASSAGKRAGVEAPGNSGTGAYRAPEASDVQLAPDRALDVHAVAVMLYQMVEGRLPFGADRGPRTAPARPQSLGPAAWEVLQAGFAADPALRPQSASELLMRLRQARGELSQRSPQHEPPAVAAPTARDAAAPRVQPAPSSTPANKDKPTAVSSVPAPQPASAPRPAGATHPREQDRLARAAAEAQRQARKEALRERLIAHVQQEAQLRQQAAAGKRPENVKTQARSPATAGAGVQPAAPADPGAVPQPPRGRLRDDFLGEPGEGPELVILSPGRFLMGSTEEERAAALEAGARKAWLEREGPRHWVAVPNAFAIARHPVTVGQWREFVLATRWKGSGDVNWNAPGFVQDDGHPVVGVNWNDAQLYVAWLSRRTGKRYRLPTEGEWEYACRAGSTTAFSFGDTIRPDQANYDARFAWNGAERGVPRRGTTPAGAYPANAWGVCDMHGNVWEWVKDVMHDSYEGAPSDVRAWEEGGDQGRRVLRGGSWLYHPRYLRSAVRNGFSARMSNDKVGFRVVREVD